MLKFTFTLLINGDVEAHLDDLYEAGCGDATFGIVDGVHYATFHREAPSFEDAIGSAMEEVESVGLHVEKFFDSNPLLKA